MRTATSTRPNLLVILSDQHNPRVLGSAGNEVIRTPNLDRLAADGTRFTAAYCASPLCVPSRATLLTGQQCSDLGVWTNSCQLNPAVPTFAHSLGAAGYDTALIGRMHFVGPDQRHGFGTRLVGDVSPPWGGHPGSIMDGLPPGTNRQTYPGTATSGPGHTSFQAYDAEVTSTTVDWLTSRARSADDRPFCLVVGMILPHNPYIAPADLYDEYLEKVDVPAVPATSTSTSHPAITQWRQARDVDDITAEQARSARAAYFGLVTLLDRNVGQIMDALETTGLRDSTAVIYTSDHGDMIGENGMWWKSSLFEGSVRVPLIASWPGAWVRDRTVDVPVSLTDLAPTLTNLGEAPELPGASGTDLGPLLDRTAPPHEWQDRAVLAENVPDLGGSPARMVRTDRWKLVHHHGHEAAQLFDLETDPDEFHDLGSSAAHEPVRTALTSLALDGWNGTRVQHEVERHVADARVIAEWVERCQPPEPDRWVAPADSNAFPHPAPPASQGA